MVSFIELVINISKYRCIEMKCGLEEQPRRESLTPGLREGLPSLLVICQPVWVFAGGDAVIWALLALLSPMYTLSCVQIGVNS